MVLHRSWAGELQIIANSLSFAVAMSPYHFELDLILLATPRAVDQRPANLSKNERPNVCGTDSVSWKPVSRQVVCRAKLLHQGKFGLGNAEAFVVFFATIHALPY
jgi:hypothetical protein